MIRVDRSLIPAPVTFNLPNGAAARERKRAAAHYKDPEAKSFSFACYKNEDVVEALELLFHRKCAYCEFPYAGGAPVDIEHYRPKAAVEGVPGHRGYWWLAGEWTNLLPSCIDCNRARYHPRVEGAPELAPDVMDEQIRYGKACQFPIAGPAHAMQPEDDIEVEGALLIDPTRIDPAEHLVWTKLKGQSFVQPRWIEENDASSLHGEKSVLVYGLNRQGLVEQRTILQRVIEGEISRLKESLEDAMCLTGQALARAIGRVVNELAALRFRADKSSPYSALASSLIEDFVCSADAELTKALRGL